MPFLFLPVKAARWENAFEQVVHSLTFSPCFANKVPVGKPNFAILLRLTN